MESTLLDILNYTDHSREKRSQGAQLVARTPKLIKELLDIIAQIDTDVSCKAAWVLEYTIKQDLTLLIPYLDDFITILPKVYKDAAVRPMAKLCELIAIDFYKTKSIAYQKALKLQHRTAFTEVGFDWMITDQKVAVKAYTMTALYWLGTEFDWVHPELKNILESNYSTGSAAYQARARQVLKKLNR